MRSSEAEQKNRPVKHFVVRCEWVGDPNHMWRFVLIDPQSAKKIYLEEMGALQQELLAQLTFWVEEDERLVT